jgi:hypothetical protein
LVLPYQASFQNPKDQKDQEYFIYHLWDLSLLEGLLLTANLGGFPGFKHLRFVHRLEVHDSLSLVVHHQE